MCSTGCNLKVGGGFPLRPLTHCLLQYCSLGTWRRRSLCQPSISYQVVGTISKTTQWAAWWIIRHQLQSIAFRCLRKFDTYRQGAWQSAARRRRREEANKIYFFQKRVWSMDYCKVRQRKKKNICGTLTMLRTHCRSWTATRNHSDVNMRQKTFFPPTATEAVANFSLFQPAYAATSPGFPIAEAANHPHHQSETWLQLIIDDEVKFYISMRKKIRISY